MLLELENVTKTYVGAQGSVEAVRDVSATLDEGEFVSLRGKSGCGKSTLLLAAGGLMRPDAGKVNVCGSDVYEMGVEIRAKFRAEHIGFVFQQFHLVPYLSVFDNVMAASLATGSNGALQDRALQLIDQFGLYERSGHRPGQLSTGERQRTALARALLNHPKLILADEPTGNLDEENSKLVFEALREFVSTGGGVLMVTHDPRAADVADRQLTLVDGVLRDETLEATIK